jgi:hypothetical protein
LHILSLFSGQVDACTLKSYECKYLHDDNTIIIDAISSLNTFESVDIEYIINEEKIESLMKDMKIEHFIITIISNDRGKGYSYSITVMPEYIK